MISFGTLPTQAAQALAMLERVARGIEQLVIFNTPGRALSEQEIIPIWPKTAQGQINFPYSFRAFALIVSSDTTGLYGFSYGQGAPTDKFQFHLTAFMVETIILGPKGVPIARGSPAQINQLAQPAATVVASLVGIPQTE